MRSFMPGIDPYEVVVSNCTDFRGKTLIDEIGHWMQRETPEEVNVTSLEFLASLP